MPQNRFYRGLEHDNRKILAEKKRMSIVISKNGENARIIQKTGFEQETELQTYIRNNPESIPLYALQEEKRLFVAHREFPTHSGPIDALAVDEEGNLYVIETKLHKNPDKRTVVAQALDYGAALWKHWTNFHHFLERLDQEAQRRDDKSFAENLKAFYDIDDIQVRSLLNALQQNLDDGSIKFVILMDAFDERLHDLILYVNQNSNFDIYAVQLEYYRFDEYEIVIPKVFGMEVKKRMVSANITKSWDESSWFQALQAQLGASDVAIVQQFYAWAKRIPLNFGWSSMRKDERATFWIGFKYKAFDASFFGFRLDGKIEFRLIGLQRCHPFDNESLRKAFVERLNAIPSITIPTGAKTLRGYPSVPLAVLKDQQAFQEFCDIIAWCVEKVKHAQDSLE